MRSTHVAATAKLVGGVHWIGFLKFVKTMGMGQRMELAKTNFSLRQLHFYQSLDSFYHHSLVSVCAMRL